MRLFCRAACFFGPCALTPFYARSFLGEAFGAATPHPADDPGNNPFAEGGHEREHRGDGEGEDEGAAAGAGAGAIPIGGGGLGFLGALLNAFGMTGAGPGVAGPGGFVLPANMGDYAIGEGGFQQILNDLMEQAAGRAGPQPAPDDMIEKLPRVKVTQELLGELPTCSRLLLRHRLSPAPSRAAPSIAPLLANEGRPLPSLSLTLLSSLRLSRRTADLDTITTCAVCQDEWALDETAIALPCKPSNHLFHEDCIVPWLKTSGTCPTCRFALVPQPGQPGYGEEPPQGQAQGGAGAEGAAPNGEASAGPGSGTGASASASGSAAAPQRPGLHGRQSSLNPLSPATARIPEVDGGSSLPGSWVWNDAEAGSSAADPDDMEVEHAGEGAAERDPAQAAREAAERRAEEERRAREGGQASSAEPIIEDVD